MRSNVETMNEMFANCESLKKVYVSDKFITDKVTSSSSMFDGCSTQLEGGAGTKWDRNNPTDKTYAHIDGGTANPGYFTDKNAIQSLTYSATGTDEAANGFGLALDLAS